MIYLLIVWCIIGLLCMKYTKDELKSGILYRIAEFPMYVLLMIIWVVGWSIAGIVILFKRKKK